MNYFHKIGFSLLILLIATTEAIASHKLVDINWQTDSVKSFDLSVDNLTRLSDLIDNSIKAQQKILIRSNYTFYVYKNEILIHEVLQEQKFELIAEEHEYDSTFFLGSTNKQKISLTFMSTKAYWGESAIAIAAKQNDYIRDYKNHIVLLCLLSLMLLALLRVNFSNRFFEIFNLNRSFSLRPLEGDSNRLRLFDQSGIVSGISYIMLFSMIVSIYYFFKKDDLFLTHDFSFLTQFGISFLVISILLVVKIFIIYIASFIFKIGRINTYYVKELINLNLLFVSVLFILVVSIFLYIGDIPNYLHQLLGISFIIFYISRGFLLYFKILKLSGFTNVYLFSYFCTTEIFPFIIGIKYFY